MTHRSEMSEKESAEAFEQVSRAQLEHNAEQGVNYWAGSTFPTMLLWAGRIFDFLRQLEQVMGHLAACRPSYDVGYRSGWDGADVSVPQFASLPPEEAGIKALLIANRVLAGAGWGRCWIEYDSETQKVVWEFPKGTAIGLAAQMEGAREHAACPFMSGFVAGWTNRALGLNVEFTEVDCISQGRGRCRFESREFIRFRD